MTKSNSLLRKCTVRFNVISSYVSNLTPRGLATSTRGKSYTFTDDTVQATGNRLCERQSVSTEGITENYGLVNVTVSAPREFAVLQNYPNPFKPTATITYDVPKTSEVAIVPYNMLGSKVAMLVNETKPARVYSVLFDGSRLASGMYFYGMTARPNGVVGQAETYSSTKKLVLMK